jgi:hypothetical protein
VTLVESNGKDQHTSVWKKAATYDQVKEFLREFQAEYGTPENVSTYRIDDVSGVWTAFRKGNPMGVLTVYHPDVFEYMDANPRNKEGY